jgi:hypothetical protein
MVLEIIASVIKENIYMGGESVSPARITAKYLICVYDTGIMNIPFVRTFCAVFAIQRSVY